LLLIWLRAFDLAAQAQEPTVHVLEIRGVINPLSSEYFTRGLASAAHNEAATVVLRLDTPGGLDTSMREMVNPLLVGALGAVIAGFGLVVLRSLAGARMAPVAIGPQAIVGSLGVARTKLDPGGLVQLAGEDWTAVADPAPIEVGSRVRAFRLEGVTLTVQPVDQASRR
jgi:membrane-bound serine protease (ClpP class)